MKKLKIYDMALILEGSETYKIKSFDAIQSDFHLERIDIDNRAEVTGEFNLQIGNWQLFKEGVGFDFLKNLFPYQREAVLAIAKGKDLKAQIRLDDVPGDQVEFHIILTGYEL